MERIKHAIEKARSQDAADTHTQTDRGHPSMPARGDSLDVEYSQTRVMALNHAHLERNRIVSFNKNDPMSWVFDVLRTQVLQQMESNGWRTVAITSPTPGSGKTVVAINLAMSIAHQTQKTAILVDFDLRKPRLGEYLGISMDRSLNDVLQGDVPLAEALVNPGLARLVLLPTGKPVPKPSEMLSSRKVSSLIQDLRERYADRIVIFDLPPILGADDAIAILPQIDCVLLVVANGMTTQSELENSIRHLAGANLLGVALNKAERAQGQDYY